MSPSPFSIALDLHKMQPSETLRYHNIFSHPAPTLLSLRALDSELRAHIRGNDPGFDLTKLAFYAEATGSVQEDHILEGQSAVSNARKASLQAAFNLFKTSLDNDHVLHERHMAVAKSDEVRARSSALASLEARGALRFTFQKFLETCQLSLHVWLQPCPWQKMHTTAWGLVQEFATSSLPTWNVTPKKQGLSLSKTIETGLNIVGNTHCHFKVSLMDHLPLAPLVTKSVLFGCFCCFACCRMFARKNRLNLRGPAKGFWSDS